jgi:hypothetical protein
MGAEGTGRCSECGETHLFFLAIIDVFHGGKVYEFDCPATGQRGQVQIDGWKKISQSKPNDAVELREIDVLDGLL